LADYRVALDIFSGPMDLLLYLVRKEEVDIYDISIAKITDQYIHYIEMLKSLDIDVAGDFLVMAATLMQIKSSMLLPKVETEQLLQEDSTDPRAELIRQLLEYKKFKDAANLLEAAADERQERFTRPGSIIEQLKPDAEPEIDIEQVNVWDLLEAFDSICKATGTLTDISHIKDDTPIDLYQIEILHRLQTEGPMSFESVFESGANRAVMIGLFLALLELIREELVWAKQSKSSSAIYLRPLTDEPAEEAVQKAILALAESENKTERKTPTIPVVEVSQEGKIEVLADTKQQTPIPIAEISSKTISATSPDEQKQEKTELTEGHK